MPSDIPFRISLAAITLLTLLVTAWHRIQAAASGEKISRKEEGFLLAISLRLGGLLLLVSTMTWLIAPQYIHWASMSVPVWLRWAGVFCGLSCSAMMHWTLSSLGMNLTDTVVVRKNATLVTRGPYRWVRHPFYVTTALVMASAALLSANWLIGAGSVLVLSLLVLRTPAEEQQLIDRFGQEYSDYAATTGRFLPRIRRR